MATSLRQKKRKKVTVNKKQILGKAGKSNNIIHHTLTDKPF